MRGSPFVINLRKTERGFAFSAIEETTPVAPKTKKQAKAPLGVPRQTQSKNTNRLMKEIELIKGTAPPVQDLPPVKREFNPLPEEQPKVEMQTVIDEEEEVECEVTRAIPIKPGTEWFSLDRVSDKERNQIGFEERDESLYRSYRNFMVEAFQRNPRRYLTFTSCRRVLRGDVSYLLKIHNFLCRQGLINYGIDYLGDYSFKSQLSHEASFAKPMTPLQRIPTQKVNKETPLDTDSLTVTVINKAFSRNFRAHCSDCNLLCGTCWYESQGGQNLCWECYWARGGEAGWTKVDFVRKMEQMRENKVSAGSKNNWCYEDNVKLLEFMGNCKGRDWNQLLEQLQGRKTIEDVIVQFMQFPINNFNPYPAPSVEPQVTADQEHIDFLLSLYDKSNTKPTQETVKQQEVQRHSEPNQAPLFKTMSQLIVGKYVSEIDQLRSMEESLQRSILALQQPLCTRLQAQVPIPTGNARENPQEEQQEE